MFFKTNQQKQYLKRLTKPFYNDSNDDDQFYDPSKLILQQQSSSSSSSSSSSPSLPDILWRKIIGLTDDVECIKYRFKEENDLIPYIISITYSTVQDRELQRRKGVSLFLNFNFMQLSGDDSRKALERLSQISKALVIGNEKSHSLSTLVVLKTTTDDSRLCASKLIELTQVSNFIVLPLHANENASLSSVHDEQPVYHAKSLTSLQLSYVANRSLAGYIDCGWSHYTEHGVGLLLTNFCLNRMQMDVDQFQKLCKLLEHSKTITNIEISSSVLSDKIVHLTDALANHTTVTRLCISDNAIRSAQPICQLLRANKIIQHLDISNNELVTPGFGAEYVLETLIEELNPTPNPLLSLNLSQCGKINTVLLGEYLLKAPMLQHLGIHRIKQDSESTDEHFFESLARNKTLFSIDLSYLKIGSSGQAFFNFFSNNTTLKRCDLSWSLQDARGIIQHTLLNNNTLTHLNLSLNQLDASDGLALGNVLEKNTSLVHLNLSANVIGWSGCVHIFKALRHNSTLTHLNLRRNLIKAPALNNNADKGVFFHALNNLQNHSQCRLKYLDISGNHLGQTASEMVLALPFNNTLYHIDLSNNHIDTSTGLMLYEVLEMNKTLGVVNFHGNLLGGYVRELLFDRYIEKFPRFFSINLSLDRQSFGEPLAWQHSSSLVTWPYLKLWKIYLKLKLGHNIYH
ncbi:hypothetical protein DFA_06316 [Cavenderia fasciculata]|uniref:Leucine-rich repeat-containing protein n=1 Tax=Cavenderia fasciculata TaxID=261658 RepID=F4PKP6_CACFS|nr:uncharacterized protein DFA_06316 [Cavenderia fasciculata]EGG24170.1 hypothetical protein DFA_06316 [Cavenderia fasciculata]|eukprot:XP_004362021.1 hypothetical protein DFA_06316 [Cavenderia fasciculata]